MEASAAVKGSETDWTFLFVLRSSASCFLMTVQKGQWRERLKAIFTGGLCYMVLSLLNPEDSYAPSGEWSFLKGINLKGLTVVYSHVAKEVSIGWNRLFPCRSAPLTG